jgi:hypothetical protein
MTLRETLESMPLGEPNLWDGAAPGVVVRVTREEDPEGPWWEATTLYGGSLVSCDVCETVEEAIERINGGGI